MYGYDDKNNPNIDRWHEEEPPYYGFDKMIGRARIKSTKSQIRISYNGETIKLNKKKLKKFFLRLAAFAICLNIAGKIIDTTWDKISYQVDVMNVRKEQCIQIEDLLSANDLNIEPSEDGLWCNDYSKLEGLSKDDIYGFYYYCGYDETEKVLKQLGYNSWDNFLTREGYCDAGGAPSFRVWENYAEAELVKEQREGLENGRKY